MKQSKWFLHPILIFIFSIAAVALSLFLYIYWYVEVSTGLKNVIQKANLDPDQVLASQTWLVILVLSILVGLILLGIFIIFVYHQKTLQLYRLQRNFINNFTHELKTPVTSLKLYLETFHKYEFSREDQLKYINYMLQDADRLDALGAIGIIRVISHDNKIPLYDMNDPFAERRSLGKSPLDHFYQKIVHLKNGFHTPEAQKPALKRHRFVLAFLDQLKQEIFLIAG